MYSLLVLGLIPGTDIQISFAMWAALATIVLGVVFWLPPVIHRREIHRNMLKIEAFNASLRKLDGELNR